MLKTFKLLLPALMPAWNFFDWIAPSPRIEYALQNSPEDAVQEWREFRPRPNALSFRATAARLFFNPGWNETLFVVSCAERLCEAPTDHSVREIFDRIRTDLIRTGETARFMRFRIALLTRSGGAVAREIAFVSPLREFAA